MSKHAMSTSGPTVLSCPWLVAVSCLGQVSLVSPGVSRRGVSFLRAARTVGTTVWLNLKLPGYMAALFIVSLLFPFQARAFSVSTINGKVVKWGISDIPYYLDPDGWSGIPGTKDLEAVIASFNDWEAVSCSFLKFHQVGTTTATSVLPTGAEANGKSELIWKEDYWPFGSYVLGVTAPLYGPTGVIQEADIAFNGTISWNTNGNAWSSMDVKSVAIHEIGHLFGLQHNLEYDESDPPTMAPAVDPWGKSASLHQDDKNGICFLYPASGSYTCNSNSDCPYVIGKNAQGDEFYASQFLCSSSSCVPAAGSGTGGLGAKCQSDNDCKFPYFCLQTEQGSWCTTWCDVYKQDCPDDFPCYAVDESSQGVCVPGKGDKQFGETCLSNSECAPPLFCLHWWSGQVCTMECIDIDGGTGCPAGYTCYLCPEAPSGKGACYPGTVTKKENGKSCGYSSECKSGMCAPIPGAEGKICREKCVPGSNTCPEGTKCVGIPGDITGKMGACQPISLLPEKSVGVSCEANWECATNYCYYDSELGMATCRQQCVPGESGCPLGTTCMETGYGLGVCLPSTEPQPDGAVCLHHYECISGFCAAPIGSTTKTCGQACTQDSDCKGGFKCEPTVDPTIGMCIPSGFEPGYSCNASSDCQSGICIAGMCRAPCNVLAQDCPPGQGCVPLEGSVSGACVSPGVVPAGGQCGSDFQCSTLLCVENEGKRKCVLPCSLAAPLCPAGTECREPAELDGLGACLPPVEPFSPPEDDEATNVMEPPPPTEQEDSPREARSGCSAKPFPTSPAWVLLFLFSFFPLVTRRCQKR